MRVLVACALGTINPPRDRTGHCVCERHRAQSAAYRRAHPRVEYQRTWRRAHPEKARQYTAKWQDAHPEERRLIVQSWRRRNPERVKAMNARGGRKWATNNRATRNASVKARQMAKRRAMPSWVDRGLLLPFYAEADRLTRETGIPHEVDHRYPLQAVDSCGLHVPGNLQVLPRSVNRSKRNRTPQEIDLWPV